MPKNPRQEPPCTYFVHDYSHKEELPRLQLQDQMLTVGMGGALPEQPDPTVFQRVLDVGCGSGGWLIELAQTYPEITQLIGIDINERMVKYAREQAEARQVSDRVQFRAMDALRSLDFPEDSFDLVNQRLGMSYLRTWDWIGLLQEFSYVTRPGGVIRLTEADMIVESSSPALLRHSKLLWLGAFQQSGHLFTPDKNGVTSQLAHLLSRVGLQQVETRAITIEYRAGTVQGERFAEDMKRLMLTTTPFLQKWVSLPEDYQEIYHQAVREMRQPGFVAKWSLLTAWGTKPAPRS